MAPTCLAEPLLAPVRPAASLPGDRAAAEAAAGAAPPLARAIRQVEPPPSFKAGRPRKTKGLISVLEKTPCGEQVHHHLDDRLVQDTDSHEISWRVAALISQHAQEGDARAHRECRDPSEDDFHEARFLRRQPCLLRCLRCRASSSGQRPPDVGAVFRMISDVAAALYFCKQVVVLCAVYVERLLRSARAALTADNWRPVVVAALAVASKVWEDVHPWNADFESCLEDVVGLRLRVGALYELESILLRKLGWQVHVDGEEYAAYFFSLLEGRRVRGGDAHPGLCFPHSQRRSPTLSVAAEEDIHCGSDSDVERGVLLMDLPLDSSPHGARRGALGSPSDSEPSPMPWSREELASRWRSAALRDEGADQGAFKMRAVRDAWRLDSHNPHVGTLRHAPRALAPSQRIQSEELLWAHALALQTADVLGPRCHGAEDKSDGSAAHTLSGSTGEQLQSELQMMMRRGPLQKLKEEADDWDEALLPERPPGSVGVSFGP